jgi:hypothetical protein
MPFRMSHLDATSSSSTNTRSLHASVRVVPAFFRVLRLFASSSAPPRMLLSPFLCPPRPPSTTSPRMLPSPHLHPHRPHRPLASSAPPSSPTCDSLRAPSSQQSRHPRELPNVGQRGACSSGRRRMANLFDSRLRRWPPDSSSFGITSSRTTSFFDCILI